MVCEQNYLPVEVVSKTMNSCGGLLSFGWNLQKPSSKFHMINYLLWLSYPLRNTLQFYPSFANNVSMLDYINILCGFVLFIVCRDPDIGGFDIILLHSSIG